MNDLIETELNDGNKDAWNYADLKEVSSAAFIFDLKSPLFPTEESLHSSRRIGMLMFQPLITAEKFVALKIFFPKNHWGDLQN
jgi:hypothetical protein